MKIYSMTATFGKLDNQTLTLRDGLNVIHAPNEWGKTTWCAFLVNMLYGMETRVKTTKTALADKERYAPWSGKPMAGRINLNWNGRDITIERKAKGRTPLGDFYAYETESGVPVAELTAANCGEMLLGVERSVFLQSGFLRLSDLPVAEDEQLRRRLNALVTTGDESDAGDILAKKLKDLKNKVYLNRSTGLIPNAESQAEELAEKIRKIDDLQDKMQKNRQAQQEVSALIEALENHKAVLEYEAAAENERRIAQAKQRAEEAKALADELARECAQLPDAPTCNANIWRLQELSEREEKLRADAEMLPPAPERPTREPTATVEETSRDAQEMSQSEQKRQSLKRLFGAMIAATGAAVLLLFSSLGNTPLTALFALLAAVCAALAVVVRKTAAGLAQKAEALAAKYGTAQWQSWEEDARRMAAAWNDYRAQEERRQAHFDALNSDRDRLNAEVSALTGTQTLAQCLQKWQNALQTREKYADAQKRADEAEEHANTVSAMARPVQKPQKSDELTYSAAQTQALLNENLRRQQTLIHLQGEYRGNIAALGRREELEGQLAALRERIGELNKTYAALELALNTLSEARGELQRRFAPKISKQAQEIFAALTGGRYDRLTIAQDMSLQAGAQTESALQDARHRSDGTIDQMYVALRLAVWDALAPDAPLILDDALVRFDDTRLAAAMDCLHAQARHRQIVLFSCQTREEQYQ